MTTTTPPTTPPGTDLPAAVGVGFVVGRFLRWVLDSSDEGERPEWVSAGGSVTLTPASTLRRIDDPSAFLAGGSVTLKIDPVTGLLTDPEGRPRVVLPVGQYSVKPSVDTGLSGFTVEVTQAHTLEDPCDLAKAAPAPGPAPSPDQVARLVAVDAELLARIVTLEKGGGGTGGAYDDTALRADLAAERSARESADAALSGRVDALAGYTDRGDVTGAVNVVGRGTVALTLAGDTQMTLTGQDGDSVLIDADLAGHTLTVEGKAVGAVSVWARSRGRWITGQPVAGGGDSGGGGGGTTTPPTGSTLVGKIAFAGVADGTDPATLKLSNGAAIAKNNTNGVISGGKWSVSSTGAVVGSTLSTAQQLTKMQGTATYELTGASGNDFVSVGIGVHAGTAGTVSLTARGDGSMLMEAIGLYTWTMPDLSTRVAPKTGTIAISFDATTGGGSVWLNGTKIGDYTSSDWVSKNPSGKAQGVAISANAFNGGKTSFDGYEMSVPA